MRRFKCYATIFSTALLFCFLWHPITSAQEAKDIEKAARQETKKIAEPAAPAKLGKTQERLINVIYQSAFSENNPVRQNAFKLLERDFELLEHLGTEIQEELINEGFKDKDPNSAVMQYSINILENSTISQERRQTILLAALRSENVRLRKLALDSLSKEHDIVLKHLIAEMRADLTGQHDLTFQLIEYWGESAAIAVPVLTERFEALQAQAIKDNPQASTPKFDYLPIVYALAEIGKPASDAMAIALSATEEQDERAEYQLAGMLCIEKIVAGESVMTTLAKKKASTKIAPAALEKYRVYAKTIMKQYDIDKDGQLSRTEMARMRRPPAGADRDKDGIVTEKELAIVYALAAPTRSATSSRSRSSRSKRVFVRDLVKSHLRNEEEIRRNLDAESQQKSWLIGR